VASSNVRWHTAQCARTRFAARVGHRTWDCRGEQDHTDVGTMLYDPAIGDLCTIGNVGLTAPDGLATSVPADLRELRERFAQL
jgi:hypothetical protein